MTGQPLQLTGDRIEMGELLGQGNRLFEPRHIVHGLLQRDLRHVGDHPAQGIDLPGQDAQRFAGIAQHLLGAQRVERDDVRHMMCPITFMDIVDDLLAAVIRKIGIDIRHRYSLRIEKTLKQQVVMNGIDMRDPQTVRDERSGRGASSGADEDLLRAGIADEVPDDQEIIREAHRIDDLQLILQALDISLGHPARADALGQSLLAQRVEKLDRRDAIAVLIDRQMRPGERHLDIASCGDRIAGLQFFLLIELRHLRLGAEPSAARGLQCLIVDLQPLIDRAQHPVCFFISSASITDDRQRHPRDAHLVRSLAQQLVALGQKAGVIASDAYGQVGEGALQLLEITAQPGLIFAHEQRIQHILRARGDHDAVCGISSELFDRQLFFLRLQAGAQLHQLQESLIIAGQHDEYRLLAR